MHAYTAVYPHHALPLSLVVVNLGCSALVTAAWMRGWVEPLLFGENAGLVQLIVLTFVVGGLWAQVVAAKAELDPDLRGTFEERRLALAMRIAPVRHIANALVLLGLIGTVIGFIVALSGVEPGIVSDVTKVGSMVATLIEGMSIALYTTLVGSVLHLWLILLYRLLEAASVRQLRA